MNILLKVRREQPITDHKYKLTFSSLVLEWLPMCPCNDQIREFYSSRLEKMIVTEWEIDSGLIASTAINRRENNG